MESKIMQVFYGNDCLPYKDSARSVHYPIVGNSFIGANNTTQIRFYVRDIGGVNNVSWVAISKLPNGQIGNEVLSNIQLDSELNEYYVVLDLSSYYTQVKGDLYISLNGYQGGINVVEDSDTGIYTITGTPIIEATGSIKLAINYAPRLPLGQHFQIDDLQQILGALSDKANVINTIQIVSDISQTDTSGFAQGQIFYDLAKKQYYTKTLLGIQKIDNGLLGSKNTILRLLSDEYIGFTAIGSANLTNRILAYNYNNQEYLLVVKTREGGFGYNACALNIYTREVYYHENFGVLDYVSYLFVDAYKITYVEQTHVGNRVYGTDGSGNQTTIEYTSNVISNTIVKRDSNSQIEVPYAPTQDYHATSKKYVDDIDSAIRDLIDTIKQNSFINVDTDEYPTLEDFLDDYPGEEGYIYLYPIDVNDLSKGYYQYIWEYISQDDTYEWEDLGTTQIDLSNYWQKNSDIDVGQHDVSAKEFYAKESGGSEAIFGFYNNFFYIITSNHDFVINPDGYTYLVSNTNEDYRIATFGDVSQHQTNTILIVDPLTNINGRVFQNYSTQNVTISGYPAIKILKNNNKLSESDAQEYMRYMTGSMYVPKYNYDYPRNTYFIQPNGQMLKPQFDNTNGLLLFQTGRIATTDYAVQKTSSAEKVYGTDELGAQTTYDVDSDLVGDGSIVRRESGTGTVVVGTPTSNTHATTKGYVDTAIGNAISNVYKIKGSATVAQINAMTNQQVGDVYNVTDSGTITLGSLQVFTGDNIVWTGSAWDKLGAEIDWTAYDEKFIAAGFFEVQPYNESTGEITFVYSSELYIMSYDQDIGVMTIEAN